MVDQAAIGEERHGVHARAGGKEQGHEGREAPLAARLPVAIDHLVQEKIEAPVAVVHLRRQPRQRDGAAVDVAVQIRDLPGLVVAADLVVARQPRGAGLLMSRTPTSPIANSGPRMVQSTPCLSLSPSVGSPLYTPAISGELADGPHAGPHPPRRRRIRRHRHIEEDAHRVAVEGRLDEVAVER